jgi:hypothetical protein
VALIEVVCSLCKEDQYERCFVRIKKRKQIQNVNSSLLKHLDCNDIKIKIARVEAAKIDEMWRFV